MQTTTTMNTRFPLPVSMIMDTTMEVVKGLGMMSEGQEMVGEGTKGVRTQETEVMEVMEVMEVLGEVKMVRMGLRKIRVTMVALLKTRGLPRKPGKYLMRFGGNKERAKS